MANTKRRFISASMSDCDLSVDSIGNSTESNNLTKSVKEMAIKEGSPSPPSTDGAQQITTVDQSVEYNRKVKRRQKSLYGVSPICRFGPKGCLLDTNGTTLSIPDPSYQKLKWHKPPLTVLIIKKMLDDSLALPFKELVCWLIQEKNMIVFIEEKVLKDPVLSDDDDFDRLRDKLQTFTEGKDNLTDKIDFVICLGGDGTLLYASTLFQQCIPPVMSFHFGSLGFLAPFEFPSYRESTTQILEGNASLLLRYRLKCVICKKDSECSKIPHIKHINMKNQPPILVLNEVVIDRGPSPYICNLDLYVEGRLVTSVQGDGIIICTPTGSTAYALAAGASMLHPNVPAIMLTPICPHSLSFRPVAVPAGAEIKVVVSPEARNSAWVSFDGRNRQEIQIGDSVRITTAQYPLPAICAKDQMSDWFESLAECLNWNVRKQQKALSTVSSTTSLDSADSAWEFSS